MSESHDIEHIAHLLDPQAFAPDEEADYPAALRRIEHRQAAARQKARAILPLIASAREEGAREMKERAANTASSVGSIERAIRALPPSLKEG